MIQFDSNGNLFPPQIIETDFETFKSTFVDAFESSRTRKDIFEQYLDYLHQLKEIINEPFFQWIDGSFVTQKIDPNDVDLVTFVDFETYNNKEKEIDLLRKKRVFKNNTIDGYFVKVYPETHKNHNWFETDKLQWIHTFDRVKKSKHSKGFIQIDF